MAFDSALGLGEQQRLAEAGADRAESALAGERGRADGLRDRLAAAEADAGLAHAVAQKAQDAGRRGSRADAARRAQGLLARLRAAWRGE